MVKCCFRLITLQFLFWDKIDEHWKNCVKFQIMLKVNKTCGWRVQCSMFKAKDWQSIRRDSNSWLKFVRRLVFYSTSQTFWPSSPLSPSNELFSLIMLMIRILFFQMRQKNWNSKAKYSKNTDSRRASNNMKSITQEREIKTNKNIEMLLVLAMNYFAKSLQCSLLPPRP